MNFLETLVPASFPAVMRSEGLGLARLLIAQRITGSIRFEEGIIGAGVHYSDSWHALLMPERPLVLS
jgi:hypothetical protein